MGWLRQDEIDSAVGGRCVPAHSICCTDAMRHMLSDVDEFSGDGVRGRRNPLKRLDSRKERAWILLPLAWIFLPKGLDFASPGLGFSFLRLGFSFPRTDLRGVRLPPSMRRQHMSALLRAEA